MVNEENLKNGKATQFRTGEEQAETARKGGIASGKSRKRKKLLKDTVEMLIKLPLHEGNLDKLTSLDNIKSGDKYPVSQLTNMTVEEAMLLKQINKAVKGDLRALEFIVSLYADEQQPQATQNKKDSETAVDNSFIEALNGKAAEVWQDDIEEESKK